MRNFHSVEYNIYRFTRSFGACCTRKQRVTRHGRNVTCLILARRKCHLFLTENAHGSLGLLLERVFSEYAAVYFPARSVRTGSNSRRLSCVV